MRVKLKKNTFAGAVSRLFESDFCQQRYVIWWKVNARQRIMFRKRGGGRRVKNSDDLQRHRTVENVVETHFAQIRLARIVTVGYWRLRTQSGLISTFQSVLNFKCTWHEIKQANCTNKIGLFIEFRVRVFQGVHQFWIKVTMWQQLIGNGSRLCVKVATDDLGAPISLREFGQFGCCQRRLKSKKWSKNNENGSGRRKSYA